MENYIKAFREDRENNRHPDLYLCIDVSGEEQKKAKAMLIKNIYSFNKNKINSYNDLLFLVDGEKILEELDKIPETCANVLRYRYGLINDRTYTLAEIAGIYGGTKERIRQIENKAMRILINRSNNGDWIVFSEADTEKQDLTPEEAARRKLLLDKIYNSNLIWVPDKEYEQEPNSMQHSEVKEIAMELARIQPIKEEKNKMPENPTIIDTPIILDGAASINKLGLSDRTYAVLRRAGIATIGELSKKSPEEIINLRNAGRKTAEEIESTLRRVRVESTTIVDTPISFDSETHIGELGFSARTYNVLSRAGITTIGELKATTIEKLKTLRNAGQKTIEEIVEKTRKIEINQTSPVETPRTEGTELEILRAKRDELAKEAEKLKQQTKSAEQLLASYDALLKGKTKEDETTPDLDEE